MSRTDTAPSEASGTDRPRVIRSGLLGLLATIVAVLPYTTVIRPGVWTATTAVLILAVVGVGILCRLLLTERRTSIRNLGPLTAQLVVCVPLLTAMLLPNTAALGVIPLPGTFSAFGRFTTEAASEIYQGVAPLDETLALRVVICSAFTVVAILIDQLVFLRGALLTAALVTIVGAVPAIAVRDEPNVAWFLLLAALVLLLLHSAARTDPVGAARGSGVVALAAGTVAVLLTIVVAPAMPVSAAWTTQGGSAVRVDASLRLGNDLRRPDPVQVMTIATAARSAPYLRMATLSRFDGEVWRPDRGDTQPLAAGFGEPDWDEELESDPLQTSIRVFGMSSRSLPVPYPAERVVGVDEQWEIDQDSRTLLSASADASGSDYTVRSAAVRPTLEQITAADATGSREMPGLPDDLPAVIEQTARDVTTDADTDYDRLIALQGWFRSEFDYSVDTPVDDGFDGTGAEAVARFLEVRSGYCIHFAGAFALMARSLDMPVRIVVGYLPGAMTNDRRGDEYVYSVTSDQLHSWPEVYFEGIGWVPFEPTATLGVPTAFASGNAEGTSGDEELPVPTTTPSPARTATSGAAPEQERDDTAASGGTLSGRNPLPGALIGFGILFVVLLPLLVRQGVRMLRLSRAARSDAASAWSEVRDTLIDLGLSPSDAETPRERASTLIDRGADPTDVRVLVDAIERVSYARDAQQSGDLSVPTNRIVVALRRSVNGRTKAAALLLPRSLLALRVPRRAA